MRAPTIRFGRYRIRYRQVPYVDRYFFVDILRSPSGKRWSKDEIRIRGFHRLYDIAVCKLFWFVVLETDHKRLDDFMEKVKLYDDYLDKSED